MISFRSDYEEGACTEVLDALIKSNLVKTTGYGEDMYCDSAIARIREKCGCADADVYFVVGGTPANMMTIAHALRPYEAVISPDSGHINGHETGAVEATGHKILTAPNMDGKIYPEQVRSILAEHTDIHVTKAAMVYISQPTELGTLYTLAEIEALRKVCDENGLYLYCDGARLASALAAKGNDVQLPDLARLCDAFYIGGTKCAALFGEALVFPNKQLGRDFGYTRKQRGGLLAKGRLLGVQFDALMTDNTYEKYGTHQNAMADKLREGLKAKGVQLLCDTVTNQLFPVFTNEKVAELEQQFGFHTWGAVGEDKMTIRLVTSWATKAEDVEAFLAAV